MAHSCLWDWKKIPANMTLLKLSADLTDQNQVDPAASFPVKKEYGGRKRKK
jgi:hypothetical protein